jgi:hypothetical protein
MEVIYYSESSVSLQTTLGITPQKNVFFVVTAVKASNPKEIESVLEQGSEEHKHKHKEIAEDCTVRSFIICTLHATLLG